MRHVWDDLDCDDGRFFGDPPEKSERVIDDSDLPYRSDDDQRAPDDPDDAPGDDRGGDDDGGDGQPRAPHPPDSDPAALDDPRIGEYT